MKRYGLKDIVEEHEAHFTTMQAMIDGALAFVAFFEKLHLAGQVYASVRPDAFTFDMETGEMTVDAEGSIEEAGVKTMEIREEEITEFMAPELLESIMKSREEGKNVYEAEFHADTDRYFMSVFLFEYFFHTGSPFEGKQMVNRCFLSPLEKEYYRVTDGCFCMEEGREDNGPVKGIQDKLIRYWHEYPEVLRKVFQRAFLGAGTLFTLRPTEVDWKSVLVKMFLDYKECSCGFRGFSRELVDCKNGTLACPKCGKIYYVLSNGMDRILLAQGEKLYECQTGRHAFDKDTVTGIVVENKNHKGLYGIKNLSKGEWRGFFPNGETKDIGQNQGIPIWDGMTLRFELGEDWSLRLLRKTEEGESEEHESDDRESKSGSD